jgi:surfeit locus 1 family protein
MRTRRLLGPSLLTLVMLALLLWLGTWQVHRLAWKTALLAQIDRAEAAPGIPLPASPTPFQKVAVTGRLRPDLAGLYASEVRDTPSGPQMGAQLIEPLERDGAPPILVVRGWVPTTNDDRAPSAGTIPTPEGATTIEGYVRPAEHPGWFSAKDNPGARRFFTLDPAAIGAALGYKTVTPFTLVAMGPTPPGGYPDPVRSLPRPPNDHLSYAITWYGLAAVLVVVFAVWLRKALRT